MDPITTACFAAPHPVSAATDSSSRASSAAAAGPNGPLAGPSRLRLPPLIAFAAASVAVHFLTNGRYGYFRDELYFIACGNHLAWGYVDMPPMVALVARLSRTLMGDSLFALRFFPALAGGATVAIAGVLAAELGGGVFAQALAMLSTLAAPMYLGVDTILTMNAFDPVLWMGCAWAMVRILKGDARWWVVFGLFAGLGLENKESMLFFGFALIAGLMLTPYRSVVFNRWFLLGGLVATALFAPTFIWQAVHQFPMYQELSNVRAGTKNAPHTLFSFLGAQALLTLPALPVWLAGLFFFLFDGQGRRFRTFGLAYLVMLVMFVALKGKTYYLAPVYPVMFAAGAVILERASQMRLRRTIRWAFPVAVTAAGAIVAPMAMPVLPVETFIRYQRALHTEAPREETRPLGQLPQLFADMFGWENMVDTVARVYNALPPGERRVATIFARNYGEAAAVDFFGRRYGLPKAVSGHMSYYLWGPGDSTGQVVIAVGGSADGYRRFFNSVEQAATVTSQYAMPDETDLPIFICRKPNAPIDRVWPNVKLWI